MKKRGYSWVLAVTVCATPLLGASPAYAALPLPVPGSVTGTWSGKVYEIRVPAGRYRMSGDSWTISNLMVQEASSSAEVRSWGEENETSRVVEMSTGSYHLSSVFKPYNTVSGGTLSIARIDGAPLANDAPTNVRASPAGRGFRVEWNQPASPSESWDYRVLVDNATRCETTRTVCEVDVADYGVDHFVVVEARSGGEWSSAPAIVARSAAVVGPRWGAFRVSPRNPRAGSVATFSGNIAWTLENGSSAPVAAGTTMRLQERTSKGTWNTAGTAVTSSAGAISVQAKVNRSTSWRLALDNRTTSRPIRVDTLTKPSLSMKTRPTVAWGEQTKIQGRGTTRVHGQDRVVPLAEGTPVAIQFKAPGQPWQTKASTQIRRGGHFAASVRAKQSGDWRATTMGISSPTRRISVTELTKLVVRWPRTVSGSFRIPAHVSRNGRWLGTEFTLHWRAGGYERWQPVDRQRSRPGHSTSLLVNYYQSGYYKLCAPAINRCSTESYA